MWFPDYLRKDLYNRKNFYLNSFDGYIHFGKQWHTKRKKECHSQADIVVQRNRQKNLEIKDTMIVIQVNMRTENRLMYPEKQIWQLGEELGEMLY